MQIDGRVWVISDQEEGGAASYYGYILNQPNFLAWCIIKKTKIGSVDSYRYYFNKSNDKDDYAAYDADFASRATTIIYSHFIPTEEYFDVP